MARKRIVIKLVCEVCGKEPEINKEKSSNNWNVVDNKPCVHCGIAGY